MLGDIEQNQWLEIWGAFFWTDWMGFLGGLGDGDLGLEDADSAEDFSAL